MNLIAIALLSAFLGVQGGAPEKRCQTAVVEWRAAALHPQADDLEPVEIDGLTQTAVSVGCVKVTENTVIVIFHIVDGRVKTFMAIPKGSVVNIIPLNAQEPEPKVKPNQVPADQ